MFFTHLLDRGFKCLRPLCSLDTLRKRIKKEKKERPYSCFKAGEHVQYIIIGQVNDLIQSKMNININMITVKLSKATHCLGG
jgi:hypothetical protein